MQQGITFLHTGVKMSHIQLINPKQKKKNMFTVRAFTKYIYLYCCIDNNFTRVVCTNFKSCGGHEQHDIFFKLTRVPFQNYHKPWQSYMVLNTWIYLHKQGLFIIVVYFLGEMYLAPRKIFRPVVVSQFLSSFNIVERKDTKMRAAVHNNLFYFTVGLFPLIIDPFCLTISVSCMQAVTVQKIHCKTRTALNARFVVIELKGLLQQTLALGHWQNNELNSLA